MKFLYLLEPDALEQLPRRPIRKLERLIPRRLLALIFPERKYTDGGGER